MFTGIIESLAVVESLQTHGTNRAYWIRSGITHELSIGQSVAHDGVCLTVEELGRPDPSGTIPYRVTAINETLSKTNLARWEVGTRINLERCLRADGRVDGHFVQGHVDTCGIVQSVNDSGGSCEIEIQFPGEFEQLVVDRGSVAVNGTSLTIARTDPARHRFTVAIIPHTAQNTNISDFKAGEKVNLEFDILGKYVDKHRLAT